MTSASPPRTSIVIPTLQEEKLLGETLAQFTADLRQRFSLEVVVSDGGSTDRTLEIARGGADVVVEHPPGQLRSIAMGRNRGAGAARGEVLVFLNADVLIEDPVKFFSTMPGAVLEGGAAAATCNVNIYPGVQTAFDWAFHNFFNGYFWLLNLLGMGMGRGECHVVRREVFRETGGYAEGIAAGEDYELFLRLHQRGPIRFVRGVTVFESPRRFRRFGYIRITVLWFLNALSVLLFRRSFSKDWEPVR